MRHPARLVLFGWLAWLLAGPVRAQDSTLTRLIRQNQFALTARGPQLSGPGWDKIRASVQKSQFVLVGEDHGMAQVPLFTAAVAREFQPAVYVAETDPYVAQTLTQLVAQPGPPVAYRQQYPEALCFYDMAEEFELVRTLRAQQARVVGLDQVYGSSAAPFYARLAGLVKSKVAKCSAALRWLQRVGGAVTAIITPKFLSVCRHVFSGKYLRDV